MDSQNVSQAEIVRQIGESMRNLVSRIDKLEVQEQPDISVLTAAVAALQDPPFSIVTLGSTSIANGATITTLTGFAALAHGSSGTLFSAGTPNRFTANADGLYEIGFYARWDTAFGSYRIGRIKLNNATDLLVSTGKTPVVIEPVIAGVVVYPLVAGDYVQIMVEQDSGGNVNLLNTIFWIRYLRSRP